MAALGCGKPADPVEDSALPIPGSNSVREQAARGVPDAATGEPGSNENSPAKANANPASPAAGEKSGKSPATPKDAKRAADAGGDEDGEWLRIADVDVSGLDIAVYPGAEQDGAANIDNDQVTLVSVNLVTSEAYDDVAGFYKARYPSAQIRENVADGTRAMIMEISGAPDLRTVRVVKRADTDDVSISLMRQQETTAN